MTARTLILIDPTESAKPIVNLALRDLDLEIKTCTETLAQQTIEKECPQIVLYSANANPDGACELASRLKSNQDLSKIHFVLIAAKQNEESTLSKAKASRIDEVIFRPFRSEQLRQVISKLLEPTRVPATAPSLTQDATSQQMLVVASNPALLFAFLSSAKKRNIRAISNTEFRLLPEETRHQHFALTIIEGEDNIATAVSTLTPIESLILLADTDLHAEQLRTKKISSPATQRIIAKPLTSETLGEIMDSHFGAPTPIKSEKIRELEPKQQSLLAARISAGIYEQLLARQTLQNADWEAAASVAHAEVLKICAELEKLL